VNGAMQSNFGGMLVEKLRTQKPTRDQAVAVMKTIATRTRKQLVSVKAESYAH